jgi:hypothetical protein
MGCLSLRDPPLLAIGHETKQSDDELVLLAIFAAGALLYYVVYPNWDERCHRTRYTSLRFRRPSPTWQPSPGEETPRENMQLGGLLEQDGRWSSGEPTDPARISRR